MELIDYSDKKLDGGDKIKAVSRFRFSLYLINGEKGFRL
jgi:hypothetical protein